MRTLTFTVALLLIGAASAQAQGAEQADSSPSILPAAQQIAAAVLPLPEDMRDEATVLGYDQSGKLVTLRSGAGAMICLADDPKQDHFHVACYHRGLEPFMARGRALRAEGVKGEAVDSVRYREIETGTLRMPGHPAPLYSMSAPAGSHDPATNAVEGARRLFVIYVPFSTAESLGLSARPQGVVPWIMDPGTPKAHIMFTPGM